MKKILSVFLSFVILLSFSVTTTFMVSAQTTHGDYLTRYNEYKDYYNNTYKPLFVNYYTCVTNFRSRLHADKNLTKDQYKEIIAFLKSLTKEKKKTFGSVELKRSSRYYVPLWRNSMYEAEENEEYDTAIKYAVDLKAHIEQRVDCLNFLIDSMNNYVIPGTETPENPVEDLPDLSVSFTIKSVANKNQNPYNLKITLTNNTDEAIKNWELSFDYIDGDVNTIWYNNCYIGSNEDDCWYSPSPILFHQLGKKTTIEKTWNPKCNIPANSSITYYGRGRWSRGTRVENATFNGESIEMSFQN